MTFWQIMIDMAMAACVALIIFLGIKRGLVKSFFRCTKLLIVVIITALVGSCLFGLCEEHIVNDMVQGKVSPVLVEKASEIDGELDFDEMLKDVPAGIRSFIPFDSMESYYNSLSGNSEEIAKQLGDKIEEVAINTLSHILSYLIAFVLVYVASTVGIILLEKVAELPILSGLNKVGGAIWGICGAYITASFAVCIVVLIFGNDFVEGTLVTRIIYNYGLLTH